VAKWNSFIDLPSYCLINRKEHFPAVGERQFPIPVRVEPIHDHLSLRLGHPDAHSVEPLNQIGQPYVLVSLLEQLESGNEVEISSLSQSFLG